MAKIKCGLSVSEGPQFNGKTIDQIRNELGVAFNIPVDATVVLNGERGASGSHILSSGDSVEFVKAGGSKG